MCVRIILIVTKNITTIVKREIFVCVICLKKIKNILIKDYQ